MVPIKKLKICMRFPWIASKYSNSLQALREKDFDFCLCDLRMPRRDGLDVLRAVTGEGLRTRILFQEVAITSTACNLVHELLYLKQPRRIANDSSG